MKKLPIFKIIPIDSDLTEIAIVEEPAIENYFLAFNEEVEFQFNADKMIITGPVMIPDKLIYRNDKLGERFVVYDAEGIQKSAEIFFKRGNKFNTDHKAKAGIQIIESWFIKEAGQWPIGTWVITAKVKDPALWEKIKQNKYQGFSFQSLFQNEAIDYKQFNKQDMEFKEKLLEKIKSIIFAEEVPTEDPASTEATPASITPEALATAVESVVREKFTQYDEKLAKLEAALAELMLKTEAVDAKVEEFGKQPIKKDESLDNAKGEQHQKETNPALKYFKN